MSRIEENRAWLKGKRVLVVGMARSGLGAAATLHACGARVVLNDGKPRTALSAVETLDFPWEDRLGRPLEEALEGIELLVPSPAVPYDSAGLSLARERGIHVWAELELGYRLCPALVFGITGTNGKTTTTALVGAIGAAAGQTALTLGNIGHSFSADGPRMAPADWAVVEVSSFQLETVSSFHPHASAILNLTPDHLDRHHSLEAYAAAKGRIFARQTAAEGDWLVLNADDEGARAYAEGRYGVLPEGLTLAWFSTRSALPDAPFAAYVEDGVIWRRWNHVAEPVIPASELRIPGAHNLANALAAVALTAPLCPVEPLRSALRAFPGVAHRLEDAGTVRGVRYINDSKGTNPDSSIKALEAMRTLHAPTVLIAGGLDRHLDFSGFVAAFSDVVTALVLLGETASKLEAAALAAAFPGPIRHVASIEEAVDVAATLATPGDTVLLSPACASWDMFPNYEIRGERFKDEVKRL